MRAVIHLAMCLFVTEDYVCYDLGCVSCDSFSYVLVCYRRLAMCLFVAEDYVCYDLGCVSRDSFSYVLVCCRRLCVL